MGSIIKEDTEGEPSAALTETGKGGLFSQGYLRDAPAREYVGAGETPIFVLMDDETGVERVQAGDRATLSPGKGYRAITVVTDRRILILVGNAEDGGDKRVTLPLVETAGARAADGALVVEMNSEITWRCHADDSGIEDVAAFVDAAGETWRDVEDTLDSVKRSIVDATSERDAGNYDDALAAMRAARDDVEAVQERTVSFGSQWPGEALTERVEQVRDRCLRTAAEIRVGYARATIDEGEGYWRDGDYDSAREAFEDAMGAYEAVSPLAERHRAEIDDVDRAMERLERSMERLDDAPLRNAIDADRRAREAEPSLDALDALADARERYEVVLELGPDSGERRFSGDRDRIREQREDVTDRFVETALEVGTEALEAGEWYSETGQTELAESELVRAVEALDRGESVADTERPAVVDDIRTKRSSANELLSALRNRSESEETRDADGSADADARPDDVLGDGAGAGANREAPVPDTSSGPATDAAADGGPRPAGAVGGERPTGEPRASSPDASPAVARESESTPNVDPVDASEGEGKSIEALLADLEPAKFERVVRTVVEAMGWRPESTASTACDYLASRDGEDSGSMAIRSFPNEADEPLTPEMIRDCADLATSVPSVERTMIVTTRPLTDAALAAARSREITVLDVDSLATTLDSETTVSADELVTESAQ